jgi:hypothetical protein
MRFTATNMQPLEDNDEEVPTSREQRVAVPLADSSFAASQISPDVTDSDIACRAYERFLERGAEHGHDLDDGFEAERELREPATSHVA